MCLCVCWLFGAFENRINTFRPKIPFIYFFQIRGTSKHYMNVKLFLSFSFQCKYLYVQIKCQKKIFRKIEKHQQQNARMKKAATQRFDFVHFSVYFMEHSFGLLLSRVQRPADEWVVGRDRLPFMCRTHVRINNWQTARVAAAFVVVISTVVAVGQLYSSK